MEDEARELNIGFVSRMTRGRPWVRLKIAATLDGRTALANGQSQWITGAGGAPRRPPLARARLRDPDRHRHGDAPTIRASRCARCETPRQPLRVIVDSRLETPRGARILQGDKVLVFAGDDGRRCPNAEVVVLPNPNGKVDLPRDAGGAGAPRRQRAARRGGLHA